MFWSINYKLHTLLYGQVLKKKTVLNGVFKDALTKALHCELCSWKIYFRTQTQGYCEKDEFVSCIKNSVLEIRVLCVFKADPVCKNVINCDNYVTLTKLIKSLQVDLIKF